MKRDAVVVAWGGFHDVLYNDGCQTISCIIKIEPILLMIFIINIERCK